MPVQLEAATESARARVGTVLNQKWHLDQLLGVGGMAAVYAATHRNKKRVAIKMLHAELSLDEAIRKRFLREVYIANSVGQRGAVGVDYDDVSDDGLVFLVMELLDGETIEQRFLRKGQSLSPYEALSVVDQVLDTLAAAHAQGIVHRDLKPENLFLTRDGTVKVLDFGIARVRELSTPLTTLAGSAIGTPAFMAPEQARGRWEDVDGRTDLWAVGASLYRLLTGKFVHSGETASETLALAATRPARSIAEQRPDLHPSLILFIDKALSYDQSARFPDATSMQQALRLIYAEMEGRLGGSIPQLGFSHLQSMPASRAITLRNVKTPRLGSERVRALGDSALRRPWLIAAAIFVPVVFVALLWLLRRAPSPVAVEPAASSSFLPPQPSRAGVVTGAPVRLEPKAVRVDDLPREPSASPSSRRR